jgi:hypothetical protein
MLHARLTHADCSGTMQRMWPRPINEILPCLLLSSLVALGACRNSASSVSNEMPRPKVDAGTKPDAQTLPTGLFIPVEGSRLKAKWVEGDDGVRGVMSWYDTKLQTACGFTTAADGKYRCLPSGLTLGPSDFADANCASPAVVNSQDACNPQQYVRRLDATGACSSFNRIYRLGAKLAPGQTFARSGTDCVASGQLPEAAAYKLGEELPASMFVGAELTPEPAKGGDQVQLVLLVAEDGTKIDWNWRDPKTETTCSLYTLEENRLRCVPSPAAFLSTAFSDSACQEGTAVYSPACGPARTMTVKPPAPGMCPGVSTVFELGPPVDSIYRVRSTDMACAVSATTVGLEYHSLGAPVPSDSFPGFDYETASGNKRIQRRRLAAPTGRAVGANFYDNQRHEVCFANQTGDTTRCLPSRTFTNYTFADANCTQPLWQGTKDACPPTYAYRYVENACPSRQLVYTLGPAFTGATYRQYTTRSDTSAEIECQPLMPAPTDVFYSLTLVPETEFAEMKLTEPR